MAAYTPSLTEEFDFFVQGFRRISNESEQVFLSYLSLIRNYNNRVKMHEEKYQEVTMELEQQRSENGTLQLKLRNARKMVDTERKLRLKAELESNEQKNKIASVRSMLTKGNKNRSQTANSSNGFDVTTSSHQLSAEENDTQGSVLCVDDLDTDFESSSNDTTGGKSETLCVKTSSNNSSGQGPKRKLAYAKMRRSRKSLKSLHDQDDKENSSPRASTSTSESEGSQESVTPGMSVRKKVRTPLNSNEDMTPTNTPRLFTKNKSVRNSPGGASCSSQVSSRESTLKRASKIKDEVRSHCFDSRTLNFNNETCHACYKRIKMARLSYRCKYCAVATHSECVNDEAMSPCSALGSAIYSLDDYVTGSSLCVPSVVIDLTNEIEERGSGFLGLYAIDGDEKEVLILKNRLLRGGKTPINLRGTSIPVLCSTMKAFFSGLDQPLIPDAFWSDFAAVEEQEKDSVEFHACLFHAVYNLPKTNKQTLAWIISHLQRITGCLPCKMSAPELASQFGPLLISLPLNNLSTPPAEEDQRQQRVVEALMALAFDYWDKILSVLEPSFLSAYKFHTTPDRKKAGSKVRRKRSILSLGRSSPFT